MAERIADKYGYRNMGQVGHSLLSPKVASYCFVSFVVLCLSTLKSEPCRGA